MAEIPPGRIGQRIEAFVYTGSSYAENATEFADKSRSRNGTETDWPQFYPPGDAEAGPYGWKGYTNQPDEWQMIGYIRDISGSEPSVNAVNVTSNDSPKNYREFIPSLKAPSQVSFDMVYDVRDLSQASAQTNPLEQIFEDREVRRFAVRVPNHRVGGTITDIAGTRTGLTVAATPSGGPSGYDDVGTSINKFKNQAFFLFSAFVTRLGPEVPMEGSVIRSVDFKLTSPVKIPKL